MAITQNSVGQQSNRKASTAQNSCIFIKLLIRINKAAVLKAAPGQSDPRFSEGGRDGETSNCTNIPDISITVFISTRSRSPSDPPPEGFYLHCPLSLYCDLVPIKLKTQQCVSKGFPVYDLSFDVW